MFNSGNNSFTSSECELDVLMGMALLGTSTSSLKYRHVLGRSIGWKIRSSWANVVGFMYDAVLDDILVPAKERVSNGRVEYAVSSVCAEFILIAKIATIGVRVKQKQNTKNL